MIRTLKMKSLVNTKKNARTMPKAHKNKDNKICKLIRIVQEMRSGYETGE